MEQATMTRTDYFAIIKRRKWSLILPTIIVFLASAIIALALPSVYKSTSTILIEEQDIPADFVMTTVTSYVEQRLQSIHHKVVSFPRLLNLINRFNLYPNLKDKRTDEEIVEKLREDIILEPISVETADTRMRRSKGITTAFTLSYEGKKPDSVHQVTKILTSMFLEENLQTREKHATETSIFLENEMEKLKADLSEIEAKIAEFKAAHINELPDLLQVNMQSLNNIENNIERMNEQLRNLKEREGYLQTQLTAIPQGFDERRQRESQLTELKGQLMHLRTRFSDKYPDVIKTRAEIAELEKQINNSGNGTAKSSGLSDNPAYITISSQLSSTQADIASVKRQIRSYHGTADMYRRRIETTPKIEEVYNNLLIERNNIQAKYDDLMRKYMEAKMAQGLEKEQKGERFTLIDPPRLPEKPYKPNRMAIMFLGFVLSIGAGVGWTSLREFNDQSIRDSDSLKLSTPFPVLANIPEIITQKDLRRLRIKRIVIIMVLVLISLVALTAFHYLFMDLNIFWTKLMRKLSL
jgi:polysaccharide chain length determinant protein (PEP-CTERM system associated)